MKKFSLLFLLLLLFNGCSLWQVNNNYLEPKDFADYLERAGVKVEGRKNLDPAPLSASSAIELKVAGSGIGVYKYDRTIAANKRRLERCASSKRIYFNGIPYPIYEVSGSFIVVGLDKNPEKKRILDVLRNFK